MYFKLYAFKALKRSVQEYKQTIRNYPGDNQRWILLKERILDKYISSCDITAQTILQNSSLTKELLSLSPFSKEQIIFNKEQLQHFYCCMEDAESRAEYLSKVQHLLTKRHPELDTLILQLKGAPTTIKIEVLDGLLTAYEPYTGLEHGKLFSELVSKFVEIINASALPEDKKILDKNMQKLFIEAARVHDIGKLLVELEIINKLGKPTNDEKEVLDRHPLYGLIILELFGIKETVIHDITQKHHEPIYPDKLQEIDKYSRIISIVDTIDACASHRLYRMESLPVDAIIEILTKSIHFDQEYVGILEGKRDLLNSLYRLSSGY